MERTRAVGKSTASGRHPDHDLCRILLTKMKERPEVGLFMHSAYSVAKYSDVLNRDE